MIVATDCAYINLLLIEENGIVINTQCSILYYGKIWQKIYLVTFAILPNKIS